MLQVKLARKNNRQRKSRATAHLQKSLLRKSREIKASQTCSHRSTSNKTSSSRQLWTNCRGPHGVLPLPSSMDMERPELEVSIDVRATMAPDQIIVPKQIQIKRMSSRALQAFGASQMYLPWPAKQQCPVPKSQSSNNKERSLHELLVFGVE